MMSKFFDLRADRFERGEERFRDNHWFVEQSSLLFAVDAGARGGLPRYAHMNAPLSYTPRFVLQALRDTI